MIPKPSFLDLPVRIRESIYSYTGLVRECPIDLTSPKRFLMSPTPIPPGVLDTWEDYEPLYRRYPGPPYPKVESYDRCFYTERKGGCSTCGGEMLDCCCPRLPSQLLLVSKAVYKETSEILYSQNKFAARGHIGADLTPLLSMSSKDLGNIKSLLVRLNCFPCLWGHEGETYHAGKCAVCATSVEESDPELNSSTYQGRNLISQWKTLCRHLSSAISPGQLELTFICDCLDIVSGRQIIKELETLPLLKACTIRLGRRRNNDLRALASGCAMSMINKYHRLRRPAFPWAKLPKELRLQILELTHLGNQGDYINKPSNWFGPPSLLKGRLCIQDNKLVTGYQAGITPPTCCFKCTNTFADCCCPTKHASVSDSCTCRDLPLELLLVDTKMRDDALKVLHSKNCFDFIQDPLRTVDFLQRLPAAALPYIRRIRFRVTEESIWEWKEKCYLQQWQALILFIKRNLDLPNLSITIDSEEVFDNLQHAQDQETNRFYYDAMVELTDALSILDTVYDIWFQMGWFTELEKVFAHRIAGDRWVDRHGVVKTENSKGLWLEQWIVPPYYQPRSGDLEIFSRAFLKDYDQD